MIQSHYETVKNTCGKGVKLCIVSKKRSIEEIQSYYDVGERIFAENHAQELKEKAALLPSDIQWQFIGHLQRNKVKDVVPIVSCIQSLDNLELAKVLSKECIKQKKAIDVLCEFHIAEEDTNKTGLNPADAISFLNEIKEFPGIHIKGIMVMGPHTDDEKRIQEVFTKAHELFTSLQNEFGIDTISTLSMGMSADYPIAIQCGSTMVRIGTYMFVE